MSMPKTREMARAAMWKSQTKRLSKSDIGRIIDEVERYKKQDETVIQKAVAKKGLEGTLTT